ncbi:MAG: alpha/beta hydrolase [Gemmataceae bacterium]
MRKSRLHGWTWTALAGAVLWGVGFGTAAEPRPEVEITRNVSYYEGPDADPVRHKLDILAPKGGKDRPVLFLVHGGAWMAGSKDWGGLYAAVGKHFAEMGYVVVLPNYRLSPQVQHPEHIKDVARAVAWTHRHIAQYGGQPDQIFLCGHSAGGHLVALLATDERYLKAEGLKPDIIKGVIAVSGVYRILDLNWDVQVQVQTPTVQVMVDTKDMHWLPGRMIFGTDPRVRREASPIHHVKPGLPPFLILYAQRDLLTLPLMARNFHAALKEADNDADIWQVPQRNHFSIMFSAATPDDPVARKMTEFMKQHAAAKH